MTLSELKGMDPKAVGAIVASTVRAPPPGRFSSYSGLHSNSGFYGAFVHVWARRALNGQKRRSVLDLDSYFHGSA